MSRKSIQTPQSKEGVIVIGIDPGSRSVGWGAVSRSSRAFRLIGAGTILLPPDSAHASLQSEIRTLLNTYQPQSVFIEKLFFEKNVRSGIRVAEMRGVVLAETLTRGIHTEELAPTTVKLQLCGHGQATKEAVSKMVGMLLGETPRLSHHAYDALAIAIAGSLSASRIL